MKIYQISLYDGNLADKARIEIREDEVIKESSEDFETEYFTVDKKNMNVVFNHKYNSSLPYKIFCINKELGIKTLIQAYIVSNNCLRQILEAKKENVKKLKDELGERE